MDRSKRAIIIPAYNEVDSIAKVVATVKEFGTVIVVNDCSKDQTSVLAKNAGAVVVDHPVNKGYEAALNTGFEMAHALGCKFAVTFDADGQHDPALLTSFFSPLENDEADLVIGIRPSTARFSESVFAAYFRLRFGVRDPLCGMKGYHMKLYQNHGAFDTIRSIGTELSYVSLRAGARLRQIPIPINERDHGSPRFGNILTANLKIFKALVRLTKL